MKKSDLAADGLEHINAQAAQLIEAIRCSAAPADVLQSCTEHMQAVVALLDPWREEGSHSAAFVTGNRGQFDYSKTDLTLSVPFSPVSGRKNPIAPAVKLWVHGDAVAGAAHFSATYAGPPDCVHGGIIAGVFDELLSMANVACNVVGYTGSLTIRYHRPTPLYTPIELSAQCTHVSGRKVKSKGEMRAGGELTASAEGLFIMPAKAEQES